MLKMMSGHTATQLQERGKETSCFMQTFPFFLSSHGFSEPFPEQAHVGITHF